MKTKNFLILLFFAFCLPTGAYSQNPRLSGSGQVYLTKTQISPGSSINIKYVVSNGDTYGRGDFRCEIRTPDGQTFTTKRYSTVWRNGYAKATFTCPFDFTNNDGVKISTKTKGTYLVKCYWYIDGYGENEHGETNISRAVFTVK